MSKKKRAVDPTRKLVSRLAVEVAYAAQVFAETCDCGTCGPCKRHKRMVKLVAEAHQTLKNLPVLYAAIVVSERTDGHGGPLRVLLVPIDVAGAEAVARELAEYGSQLITMIDPDYCNDLTQIRAIFDEMNPPGEDDNETDEDP